MVEKKPDSQNEELTLLRQFADLMRTVPVGAVLSKLNYIYDLLVDGFQTERGVVRVVDDKVKIDDLRQGERQPRNSIDLVMALRGVDYSGALAVLRDEIGARVIALEAVQHAIAPSVAPNNNSATWTHARRYLIESRGIPESIVDGAYKKGLIYSDDDKNAVFRLRGGKGYELRGTRGDRPGKKFRGTRGDKEFFILPAAGAPQAVAFVESSIEALSFRALYGDHITVASTGGENKTRLLAFAAVVGRHVPIIAAFNADIKGEKYTADLRTAGFDPIRLIPTVPATDWNKQLTDAPNSPPAITFTASTSAVTVTQ